MFRGIVCFPVARVLLSGSGAPSRRQHQQISLAARSLPNVRTIVLAQDHDEAGERQAETLRTRLKVPPHAMLHRRRPPENADWNDIINTRTRQQAENEARAASRQRRISSYPCSPNPHTANRSKARFSAETRRSESPPTPEACDDLKDLYWFISRRVGAA